MIVWCFDKNLRCFGNAQQDRIPTLLELGINNAVLAFDQSTKRTGITVGNSRGEILGFVKLTRESSDETGQTFISNFERWLPKFISGCSIDMLLYEGTYSKQYFRTDLILSQLRGSFQRLKDQYGWKFPIEMVMQQTWKKNIIDYKRGEHSQTKENAHYVLLNMLCPWLPNDEDAYEDIYDSLCIFFYYTKKIKDFNIQTPINVNANWKNCTADFKLICQLGKEPNLLPYDKIVLNRGIRYFNYNLGLSPYENISKLVNKSNDFWIATVDQENNPWLDTIVKMSKQFPALTDKCFVMGYRKTKKKSVTMLR